MKKYNIEVVRTDEFLVEIDETEWTFEEIKKWASVFWPAETPEDIAKHLAQSVSRLGTSEGFYEGFGYVKMYRPDGSIRKQFDSDLEEVKEENYTVGLAIWIISLDEDYETEITEP